MLIKFLSHGTGDPHKAVQYLMNTHDHNGILRPEVRVLRGNPNIVADLAASLSSIHRYTSGVIAWAPGDAPTSENINAVLNDFEQAAFAGLDPDQYSYTAISHGSHVHFLVARTELRTGLALNIAPPNRKKIFDEFRNYWNFKMGWARPDDPRRMRLMQPGPMASAYISATHKVEQISKKTDVDSATLCAALEVEPNDKDVITQWLLGRIRAGKIKGRQDVLSSLSELGELNRIGDEYISVRISSSIKPIRLKGFLYSKEFDPEKIFMASVSGHSPDPVKDEPNEEAALAAKIELERLIESRKKFNREVFFNRSRRRKKIKTSQVESTHFRQVATPLTSQENLLKEINNERNRNLVVGQVLAAFEAARNAVSGFIRVCIAAIPSYNAVERASRATERASRAIERTSEIVRIERTRIKCWTQKEKSIDQRS